MNAKKNVVRTLLAVVVAAPLSVVDAADPQGCLVQKKQVSDGFGRSVWSTLEVRDSCADDQFNRTVVPITGTGALVTSDMLEALKAELKAEIMAEIRAEMAQGSTAESQ